LHQRANSIDSKKLFAENVAEIVLITMHCQRLAIAGRLNLERRTAMVPIKLKRVVMCAAVAVWMLGLGGCGVKQADYDAKVGEAKELADKAAKAEAKADQMQKDIDAAKSEVEKAAKLATDAETKVKTLEQENGNLKKQVEQAAQLQKDLDAAKGETQKLQQENGQLQKDLAAAKGEVEKSQQAKNDAEAKIKTLEQEKADLQKQIPKPEPPK
jgi:hypothetical protein